LDPLLRRGLLEFVSADLLLQVPHAPRQPLGIAAAHLSANARAAASLCRAAVEAVSNAGGPPFCGLSPEAEVLHTLLQFLAVTLQVLDLQKQTHLPLPVLSEGRVLLPYTLAQRLALEELKSAVTTGGAVRTAGAAGSTQRRHGGCSGRCSRPRSALSCC